MSDFLARVGSVPASTWILAGCAIVAAVAAVQILTARLRFARRLKAAALAPAGTAVPHLRGAALALGERTVLRRARSGFRGAPGPFPGLPARLGYAALWQAALRRSPTRRTMALALEFLPDEALFSCFSAALSNAARARELSAWMDSDEGAFALRRIALSGPGRDFDGSAARAFLAERLGETRELLGDQEWAVRVFALRVIMGDQDERSLKGVADSLRDPHPLARRLVAERGTLGGREEAYAALFGLMARDPSLEVRKAARERIRRDYADLHAPANGGLTPGEALHLLALLDPADPRDEELAFRYLSEGSEEERLGAAEYLDARGSLAAILETAATGDAVELDRRLKLLAAAARLHVGGFLASVERIEGEGSFLLAARLLSEAGDSGRIAQLARRWFSAMDASPRTDLRLEIYRTVAGAAALRGDQDAHDALAAELMARRREPVLSALILAALGDRPMPAVAAALRALFLDADFPPRAELRAALLRQDRDAAVPLAFACLGAERGSVARVVRRDALFLVAELGLGGALQRLVESLSLLTAEEAASFSSILETMDPKLLEAKLRPVLDSVDGPSRAAAMAVIPAGLAKSFLSDIKAAIRDADPDVRAAAATALSRLQEGKALAGGGMDLLRDPVERVRVASSRALAEVGGQGVVEGLRAVLADANEVDEVKRSVIAGLGRASDGASLDLLVDELGLMDPFLEDLFAAIAGRCARRDLTRLVERFKDATGGLKERLAESFRRMGPTGEDQLAELLAEDIASLKPFIVEALETTGYVEARIRELRHRDPAVRREAAAALDRVGNRPAFRGIVLAARDPDPAVRVAVTRALERLAGAEGAALLAELESDPDAKVRRYVLWAMERVRAKTL